MKTKLAIAAAAMLALSGCMMPNYTRMIPENKSAHLMIYSPIYGWAVIDTRVVGDTNTLYPLPAPAAVPTPAPVTLTK